LRPTFLNEILQADGDNAEYFKKYIKEL